jgi:hypothetical protein
VGGFNGGVISSVPVAVTGRDQSVDWARQVGCWLFQRRTRGRLHRAYGLTLGGQRLHCDCAGLTRTIMTSTLERWSRRHRVIANRPLRRTITSADWRSGTADRRFLPWLMSAATRRGLRPPAPSQQSQRKKHDPTSLLLAAPITHTNRKLISQHLLNRFPRLTLVALRVATEQCGPQPHG